MRLLLATILSLNIKIKYVIYKYKRRLGIVNKVKIARKKLFTRTFQLNSSPNLFPEFDY